MALLRGRSSRPPCLPITGRPRPYYASCKTRRRPWQRAGGSSILSCRRRSSSVYPIQGFALFSLRGLLSFLSAGLFFSHPLPGGERVNNKKLTFLIGLSFHLFLPYPKYCVTARSPSSCTSREGSLCTVPSRRAPFASRQSGCPLRLSPAACAPSGCPFRPIPFADGQAPPRPLPCGPFVNFPSRSGGLI